MPLRPYEQDQMFLKKLPLCFTLLLSHMYLNLFSLERDQDMEIEKTHMKLEDLATKVDQTAFTQKVIHFWNLKQWLFGG